jgi:Ca2+-binding EF-hand superfamily protein
MISNNLNRKNTQELELNENELDDLKAIFVSITKDLNRNIRTKNDLFKALQCSGRNPSLKSVDEYFNLNRNEINFKEFYKIALNEPILTRKELIDAFQILDINKDGFLSLRELKESLIVSK